MPSLFAAAAAMLLPGASAPKLPFFLHDGDRVVFYGDSITDAGTYGKYIESFVLTRFPKLNVSYINSGWSGDRVSGGGGGPVDVRLDRDVIARKPTVVTIMLGMNDGNYRPFDGLTYDSFHRGYLHIVEKLRRALPGARLVLIKPSAYDDIDFAPAFTGGYNAVLEKFGEGVSDVARMTGAEVVDFNGPMVETLTKARAYDPEVAARLIPDRIHPEPAGHLVMAEALLKAWHAPSTVSYLEIDAAHERLVERDQVYVRELKFDRGASWVSEENSLPFPLEYKNPRVALVIRSSGSITDLNKEGLRVRGLQAPEYSLLIDDLKVGVFSRQQLEDGIELSNLDTPMTRQAWQVVGLTQQRAALQYAQWRTVEIGLAEIQGYQRDQAIRSMDAFEQAVIRRQKELATPHPHRFQLVATN